MNTHLRARDFKSRLDIIVAIFGLAFVLVLTIFGQARAGEAKLALITPNDVKAGSLLLKSTEGGKYLEAPRLATDFNVTISGPTARTIVTQRFENPADGFVEGVYVFPAAGKFRRRYAEDHCGQPGDRRRSEGTAGSQDHL